MASWLTKLWSRLKLTGRREPPTAASVVEAVLLTRPGCCLCAELKASLQRAAQRTPVHLIEIDISSSPDLEAEYGERIPLAWLNGLLSAKYRISEPELHEKLARARRAGPQRRKLPERIRRSLGRENLA